MAADSITASGSDRTVSSTIVAADPQIRNGPPAEAKRLCAQSILILRMFAADTFYRVSNHAMATVALKYTSRISDLRGAGHQIIVWERCAAWIDGHYRPTGKIIYQYNGWECPRCHAAGGNPLTMGQHQCVVPFYRWPALVWPRS